MTRGAALATLGTLFALSTLLLPAPSTSRATELATWHHAFIADRARLAQLRDELESTADELAVAVALRDRTLSQVQLRLVSIYKAGGAQSIAHLASTSGSVERAGDITDAAATIARHDAIALREVHAVTLQIQRLRNSTRELRADIRTTSTKLARDKVRLAKAVRNARAARIRADRMAQVADSPLAPRAMAPETIELGAAGSAGGASDEAGAPVEPPAPTGYSESGEASIYASSFTGEATASGEPYNPGAMTAAHRTLPLGTWVVVSGPGGTALVRINDRGPFAGGRIIDLSPVAAAAVGVNGLGDVTISVQD